MQEGIQLKEEETSYHETL